VKWGRSTEGGDARGSQGATTENTGLYFEGGATMRGAMQRRPNAGITFTSGC
jgi:hypothetical protein